MHDEPTFACTGCFDEPNGWRSFWCPGAGRLHLASRPDWAYGPTLGCGVSKSHDAHAYVERCECFGTNPVVRARKEREARQARERQHGEAA